MEKERVFGKSWQWVAESAAIQNPGDYLAVNVGGASIIILKSREGKLQGFHNVCRHRAFEMLPSNTKGQCDVLRCKYHGWAYDMNGKLKVAPEFALTAQDKDNFSLFPVKVEEWRGFVFVNLDMSAPSYVDSLGEVNKIIAPFPFETARFYHEIIRDFDFNWKVYIDNYQEAYHVPVAHPTLASQLKYPTYSVKNDTNGGRIPYSLHEVERSDGRRDQGLWVYMFPNYFFNVYPIGLSMECIVPLSAGKIRYVNKLYYFHSDDEEKNAKNRAAFDDIENMLFNEDITLCQGVWKNLVEGKYSQGVLHPTKETGVRFWQQMYKEKMGLNDRWDL